MTSASNAILWTGTDHIDVAGRPTRIVPLVLGYEPIAEGVSVAGGSRFRYLLEPVTSAAIVYESGWVLVDGGFDPARVRDARLRRESYDYANYTPIVPEGDPLRDQLAEAGLRWDDLAAVLLSHAHFDHTGALRLLGPDQPALMQRREWEHVMTVGDPRAAFVFPQEFTRPGLRIGLLDGDREVAAGLIAIDTSGHTPGHQSFVVELPDHTVVLACDAADLRRNIDETIPCGSTVGADGPERARRAVERLHYFSRNAATSVWPGHDPDWEPWRAIMAGR